MPTTLHSQYLKESTSQPHKSIHYDSTQYKPSPEYPNRLTSSSIYKKDSQLFLQLIRQKEKNRILKDQIEQKLNIIAQMKEFHSELSLAFQQCQLELSRIKNHALDNNNQVIYEIQNAVRQEINQYRKTLIQLEQENVFLHNKLRNLKLRNDSLSSKQAPKYLQRFSESEREKKTNLSDIHKYKEIDYKKIFVQFLKNIGQYEQIQQSIKIVKKFMKCLLEMFHKCQKVEEITLRGKLKHLWKWLKYIVKQYMQIKQY